MTWKYSVLGNNLKEEGKCSKESICTYRVSVHDCPSSPCEEVRYSRLPVMAMMKPKEQNYKLLSISRGKWESKQEHSRVKTSVGVSNGRLGQPPCEKRKWEGPLIVGEKTCQDKLQMWKWGNKEAEHFCRRIGPYASECQVPVLHEMVLRDTPLEPRFFLEITLRHIFWLACTFCQRPYILIVGNWRFVEKVV